MFCAVNGWRQEIFNPELLRRRVIELFGFEAFKRAVADLLGPFVVRRRPDSSGDRIAGFSQR